jgi:HAD superfamily hydrolase (TIGR01549 family)
MPNPNDILFWLEPRVELGNPLFRLPTLRNSVLPQMEALRNAGRRVLLICGEAVALQALKDRLGARMGEYSVIPDAALRRVGCAGADATGRWLTRRMTLRQEDGMIEIVRKTLPDDFDPATVIAWESPVPYLAAAFPEAAIFQQMPGLFSRPPFPELVAFDTGLLAATALNSIRLTKADEDPAAQERVAAFRKRELAVLRDLSPLADRVANWRHRFGTLLLLPLQIDDYFMVDQVLPEGHRQLDLLIETLTNLPRDIGLVVTEYTARGLSSGVLTPETLTWLRIAHPNFIHEAEFAKIPQVSQYLAAALDGTLTISSSLGYQAALWQKPMLAVGTSQVSRFATAEDLPNLVEQAMTGGRRNRDPLLHAVLTRMHPSMQGHLKRPGWLAEWLQELTARSIDGRLAAGDWPAFDDDPEETFALLAAHRREKETLIRGGFFSAAKAEPARYPGCAQLSDQIARRPIISFDIFDTLLQRPFGKPSDLFVFIAEEAAAIANLPMLDFRAEREAAEREAFLAAREAGLGETTIKEIYERLALRLELTNQVAEQIMRLEMQAEYDLLYRRDSGYRAYKEAQVLGRRIILVSDMYLPADFLVSVLTKNGYENYEALFVSCEHREKKHSGRLYDIMLEQLGVAASDILHVGDNVEADVRRAKEKGLKPFHLRKAIEAFQDLGAYKKVWKRDEERHSIDARTLVALAANRLSENPYAPVHENALFDSNPWRLGHYGLGPLLLGLATWTARTARREGFGRLHFLARDGKVMHQAYEVVRDAFPGAPAANYLLCSRRAVNVARLERPADVMDLLHVDFAKTSLGQLLEERFGLHGTTLPEALLAKHGFTYDLRVSQDDRPALARLLREACPAILEGAANERELYLAYLAGSGLGTATDHAVVDIGYAGTMQESLHRLLGGVKLGGLYLVTFRPALKRVYERGLPIHGYLGNFVDRHDTTLPFCRHVPLYETLFSCSDTSFVRFERDWKGDLLPIFRPNMPSEARRMAVVAEIQQGAMDYVRKAADIFGSRLANLDIEPAKAIRVLQTYFASPHPVDARILAGIHFEDAYGGGGVKTILPQLDAIAKATACVWGEGLGALRHDLAVKSSRVSKTPARRPTEATSSTAKGEPAPQRAGLTDRLVKKAVDVCAAHLISRPKQKKLQEKPEAFFADTHSRIGRWVSQRYLAAAGQQS